ncbi:hypothetical protein JXQ70_10260 [bacterium]|nr:hypothetical protein [bacterium]
MNDRIKLAGVICMTVLLLYVLSFQGCSDNDDDDGPSPTPTPTPTIITFMIRASAKIIAHTEPQSHREKRI